MSHLLFYYVLSRVIMIFLLLISYTGAPSYRKTNEMTVAVSRGIMLCFVPIAAELWFLELFIRVGVSYL